MAEPDQETGLLDGTVSHALSDNTGVVDATQVQADHDGMNEELLRQALADANAFESSITYAEASDEAEVCDTGQEPPSCVSNGIVNTNQDVTVPHITSNTKAEAILTSTSGAMFSNGTDSLLANGNSEVLGMEPNGTYTVDVGSLPEGHIISIPNDIISRSVIISQSNDEQFQQSVIEGNDDTQILQDETNQLVQQIEPQYVQQAETQLLQPDNSQLIQNETFTQPHAITVSAPSDITMTQEVLQNVIQQVQAQQLAQQQAVAAQKKQSSPAASSASPNTVSFTLVSPSQHNANSPPLGSSQNPIRIIQQGNRYTPMQQLTSEQLQQIMQVVQQQHVNKNSQENGGTVIFNPQTNTRIMYRVIYPSELHKTQNAAGHTTYQVVHPSTSSQEQQTPHQKRQYRKRKDIIQPVTTTGGEEDKEKSSSDVPELSKEEKEERKKHRPRTRSGRVSKPPKHMVQDYKHIHVLDWDEDYDDSDGGYSDFKHSDEDGKVKPEGEEEHSASPEFFQALGAGRPKNHKCHTCDKSYIGQAGLARHYRLNPDHCIGSTENGSISSLHNGSLDGEDSKDAPLHLQDGSSSRMSDSAAEVAKVICNSVENFSEDSNTQDSLNSTGATSPVVRRGRGRGGFRGRWAHLKHSASVRRKNKLKELMKQCTDEDLMEVVLPRLVNSISLWEYLMMKSEKGGARPQIDVIYREFEALCQHVRQACADYMGPLSQEELEDDNLQCKMIKIPDKSLAVCLNMEPVTYRVKEMPPGDSNSFSSLHNKLSAAAIKPSSDSAGVSYDRLLTSETENGSLSTERTLKRPLPLTPQEQGEGPLSKRACIVTVASPATWNHVQTPASVNSIVSTLTATASVSTITEEKVNYARSDSSLSSISSISASSVTSPQSQPAPVSGQSSNTASSSSATSAQAITTLSSSLPSSSKSNSTFSNVRSPFIHISCPTTKQQPVSYILAGPRKPNPVSSRAGKTQSVPVIINQTTGASSSTAQVLPYIVGGASGSVAGMQQKVIVAAPGSQALQPGTVPIVLATPGTQQSGSATVLLTSGTSATGHRVVVSQPAQTGHQPSRVVLTNPLVSTKSPKLSGSLALSASGSAVHTTTTSTTTSSRSLLGLTKPTEVRVSRQLFHDTTSPSVSSSSLTNGRSTNRTTVAPSLDIQTVFQQLPATTTAGSSSSLPVTVIGNGVLSNGKTASTKSGTNKTLVTPPSGQQYITSPNKAELGPQLGVADSDVEDLTAGVLSSIEFSGDDLGALSTSADTLNGSLSVSTNLTDSVVTDMAANSSVSGCVSLTQSQAAGGTSSFAATTDMAHGLMSESHSFETVQNGNINGMDGMTLTNGSSSEFSSGTSSVKQKDGGIINQTSPLTLTSSVLSSSSSSLSATSDFINLPSKSISTLIPPFSKDSSSFAQSSTYHMVTNGSLPSQVLKSDLNTTSSIMMADMSGLTFTDQVSTHSTDTVSSHLNGISPLLSTDDVTEATTSILEGQIPGTENQDTDNQILDTGDVTMTDTFTGEELFLSEGTNIYQTDDGTLIIQSANGNTYQLHGAQGMSLETVQALLSGTLDQLAGGDSISDGSQMNVQLH